MDFLGIRILLRLPAEAEYSEDYTVIWSYEGPNPIEIFETALKTIDMDEDDDYLVQVKEWEYGTIVWKTIVN